MISISPECFPCFLHQADLAASACGAPEDVRFALAARSADLVLSKGQGNFETLVGRLPNAFFLLLCKCPVISRAVGRPEREFLLLDGGGRAAG